ncbi:hypothetical protein OIE63_33560 [Streptomyces sp. NBC_01795]|uniref:hypothetical protein n=1 Tax=unclassified Streptomyces TaxID=2593676 RepID=UPI002DDA2D43|nr:MULTISPECIES: hypothetical protein [unclassified Streptomyces]WSA95939.1 hypothetical protein OIE63_33560 [Streptomyces sp. NBC_01795]WSS11435.1 hypothetical protein OG533_05545 [Streptomyces sp. NBC_01186]
MAEPDAETCRIAARHAQMPPEHRLFTDDAVADVTAATAPGVTGLHRAAATAPETALAPVLRPKSSA